MRSIFYQIFFLGYILATPLPAVVISQVPTDFLSPTEKYLAVNDISKIKPHLKSIGIRKAHVAIINQVIQEEKLGFFGYHGARREFLIFQDIIRYGIEEILGIPIRSDFHFLRIPGLPNLNVDSVDEFLEKHPHEINDNLPLERLQLLAMNIALYSPHQEPWELSLHYFSQNTNVAKHNYEKVLIPFFLMLGVDPIYIHEAFEIGESMLTKKSGVLLQFFDNSLYRLVDQQTYLAIKKGARYFPSTPLSHLLLDLNQTKFPQFRLILNNQYTLNPSSSLSIKRYTLTDNQKFESYQNRLREYFQSLPFDKYQSENYREKLLSLWEELGLPPFGREPESQNLDLYKVELGV